MTFRITGIDPAPFAHCFVLSDPELAALGAMRVTADASPGYPCRVSLEDAQVGEELLLVPFEHHPTTSPYRASGPIYVRRAAKAPYQGEAGVLPTLLRHRLLSVRAYDRRGLLVDADVCTGEVLDDRLARFFAGEQTSYLHIHNARPGCFMCRVDRGA